MVVNSAVLPPGVFGRSRHDITIVYDGECPFCSNYVRLQRLRSNIGAIGLVNAREHLADARLAKQAGFDVDEGMLVFWRGELYSAGDAVFVLTRLGTRGTGFNLIGRALFSNARVARLLYPVLRGGRNLTLRLLGRRKLFGRVEEREPQ